MLLKHKLFREIPIDGYIFIMNHITCTKRPRDDTTIPIPRTHHGELHGDLDHAPVPPGQNPDHLPQPRDDRSHEAATVLKNSPPSKNDSARLRNGAL